MPENELSTHQDFNTRLIHVFTRLWYTRWGGKGKNIPSIHNFNHLTHHGLGQVWEWQIVHTTF